MHKVVPFIVALTPYIYFSCRLCNSLYDLGVCFLCVSLGWGCLIQICGYLDKKDYITIKPKFTAASEKIGMLASVLFIVGVILTAVYYDQH